ncbi:MAG: hypothetical protein FJW34_05630, partial [Acidobacteria bacterium]|nr:hypothetical protein [Acidobacteriota bacterium]
MLACAGTASAQVMLSASPSPLSFAVQPGGSPTAQILNVGATSPVAFTVTWSTTTGGNWLAVSLGAGQTPTTLFVLVTPGSLTAGTYYGTIAIAAVGVANSPLSVPVTLTVGPVAPGQLAAAPTSVSFTHALGGAVAANQNVLITSTTASQVNFNAAVSTSSGGNWLNINISSGTTPVNISVGVNPTGLSPGTYNGTVTLTPVSVVGGSLQVPVTLVVTGTPQLSASPSSVTFPYQTGTSAPAQQTVALTSGGTPVTFTAIPETTSGGNWLVVTPNFAVTPSDLTVGISSAVLAALPAGDYPGKITVTAPQASNSPLVIPVTLLVRNTPFLTASVSALSFTMLPGGPLPAAQNVTAGSTGTALPFTVSATTTTPGVNWLSFDPAGGITPRAVAVSVASAALTLPPGTYTGTVTLSPTTVGVPSVSVPVTLTVSGAAALVVSPTAMVFNYQIGRVPPAIKTLEVKSTGVPVGFTSQVVPGTGGNWLQISATSGTTPATLSVGVNPAGMAVGTYQSAVSVTPADGGAAVALQVTLNVSNSALMNVSPEVLTFDFVLGSSAFKTQDVALTSTGDPLNFTMEWATTSGGSNWMAVTPSAGTTPANLTVFVIAASLPLGTYTGSITVRATGANTQVIPVKVTVTSGVNLAVTPTTLTFTQAMGGAAAQAQKLALTSTGASVRFTASATTGLTPTWLAVTPGTGSTPAELSVTVDATRLPQPGTYYG